METANKVRYYNYISGVLMNQMSDPLCSTCSALANSINSIKEDIKCVTSDGEKVSDEFKSLVLKAKKTLSDLIPPQNAVGQKKAGNCKMPKGICFVKISKAIIETI